MSSLLHPTPPARPTPQPVWADGPLYPITVEDYHRMIASGAFGEDDPVELVEGVLVFKMPKNKAHTSATTKLNNCLKPLLPAEWAAQVQDPITLADGEPEPDFAVVLKTSVDRAAGHAGPGEIGLVIEVSDSSLARDRGGKLRSYARAGLPVYWIVNLLDRTIEVYTDPDAAASPPVYRNRLDLLPGQIIALPEALGGASCPVDDLLPAIA